MRAWVAPGVRRATREKTGTAVVLAQTQTTTEPAPSQTPTRRAASLALRLFIMVIGLFIFSVGLVLNVRANLGLGPWNVFHYGLMLMTPLTFGQVSIAVGFCMILISLLLGIRPGIATFANMVLVGVFIDLTMPLIRDFHEPLYQYPVLVGGILVMGIGTAIYIKVGLGAGPRDSFMLGLTTRLGWHVGVIRSLIEGTVLVLGFLMGGPVGVGTVVFVLGIGPSVELFFRLLRVPVKKQAPAKVAA